MGSRAPIRPRVMTVLAVAKIRAGISTVWIPFSHCLTTTVLFGIAHIRTCSAGVTRTIILKNGRQVFRSDR